MCVIARKAKPDTIVLSAAGWKELQQFLRHPPKPNARLKKAFAEHARVVVPERRDDPPS
jgi:uncharacterized protein (DUF1778 family)